jgi:hypothetical protein
VILVIAVWSSSTLNSHEESEQVRHFCRANRQTIAELLILPRPADSLGVGLLRSPIRKQGRPGAR